MESIRSSFGRAGRGRFAKLKARLENPSPILQPQFDTWIRQFPAVFWTAKSPRAGARTWALNERDLKNAAKGEVDLERRISEKAPKRMWAQTPTCSGTNISGARRRSIDLIEDLGNGYFCFIELKTNEKTNNPVFAAVELIQYALFYFIFRNSIELMSRVSMEAKDRLLNAKGIDFRVLARDSYYQPYQGCLSKGLARIEAAVSSGLQRLGGSSCQSSFRFWVLGPDADATAYSTARLWKSRPPQEG